MSEVLVDMSFVDMQILCVFGNREVLQKKLRKVFDEPSLTIEPSNTKLGETFMKDGYIPVIWVPRKPKKPREYGTLAHEATHAVSYMFRYLKTPINEDTEEIFSKAVGYIVQKICLT